jgi:cold shock CspA family protein
MAESGAIERIIRDARGQELFNATSVEGAVFDELHEGDHVEFERERDPPGRGERAAHVRAVPS